MNNRLLLFFKKLLLKAPYQIQMLLLAFASFGCYTSMYAYRKAFTAATFNELSLLAIDYKVWLVIAQVFGYMLSKFYGIKFVSELGHQNRGKKMLIMIFTAWMALLGFALTPAPFNIIFMFINGLPLGMIWGIVFSYLEGRKITEFLAAVMSVSLVFASGFVKTLAKFLMEEFLVSANWMPFVTGLLFVIPLLLFTFLLENLPSPNQVDIALRTERKSMNHADRMEFIKKFLPGLILIILCYLMFSILRDIRDNFEVEIWNGLGIKDRSIYLKTDSFIAIIVLSIMSLLICIKGNLKAFSYIHILLLIGCITSASATILYENNLISNINWMICTGLGLYLVYIPFNAIFFERFLATFEIKGNIGFLMYLADSIGYLGSVLILLMKEFSLIETGWTEFFKSLVILSSSFGALLILIAFWYFKQKFARINSNLDLNLKISN